MHDHLKENQVKIKVHVKTIFNNFGYIIGNPGYMFVPVVM